MADENNLTVDQNDQRITQPAENAQVIKDDEGRTVASASTLEKDVRSTSGATVSSAQDVGKRLAERAKAAGITQVVFDRGGFLFHGRVKALADAAREGGLEF